MIDENTSDEELDEASVREDAKLEQEQLRPDWPNAPTVSDLQGDHVEATPDHEAQVAKVTRYLDLMNVTGSAVPNTRKGRSSVQPKVIRKQAEWRYPGISAPFLSGQDIINAYPVSHGDAALAEQEQAIINYQYNNQMDKQKFIDETTRTFVDEGTVFIYTGWKSIEEEYQEEVPDYQLVPVESDMEAEETIKLVDLYSRDPQAFKANSDELLMAVVEASMQEQVPYKAIITGSHIEVKTRIIANHPAPEVLDYRSFIPDPTCNGDMSKANFGIRIFDSSLAELHKEDKYSNLDSLAVVQAKAPESEGPTDTSFTFRDKPRQKLEVVEYWGYWDITGENVLEPIVAAWVGDIMIRLDKNPMPNGDLPFESAKNLPIRKSNYGEPDGALIADNQSIIGSITRGNIDLLALSANAQVGTAKNSLDPLNKAKFKRGDAYEYNPNADPMKVFYMHKFPEIPQSAWQMIQHEQGDAESMTGVKAYSGANGLSGDALGSTATAVKSATDASSLRNADILRRMGDLITSVTRKYIAMNALFLSEEEVTRITNKDFVQRRKDDPSGGFDINLAISTPEEDNNKAQELAFMLQTIGPKVDETITFKIMAKISRLRNMPEVAHDLENYQPPPPSEHEQMMQQLQLRRMEAEIAEIESRTIENRAGAQLDAAKAGTEGAKTGNLQSDTDLKDLSFVEQESGVHQERSKELAGQQAKSQMDQKAFEAGLDQAADERKLQKQQGNPTVSTGLSQE